MDISRYDSTSPDEFYSKTRESSAFQCIQDIPTRNRGAASDFESLDQKIAMAFQDVSSLVTRDVLRRLQRHYEWQRQGVAIIMSLQFLSNFCRNHVPHFSRLCHIVSNLILLLHADLETGVFMNFPFRRQSSNLQIWLRYKFFILIGGSLLWARIKDGDGNEMNHQMSDSMIFQKFVNVKFDVQAVL